MPLQRTFSFANLNNENQPEKINLSLSPLATDTVRFRHSCKEARRDEGAIDDLPSAVSPSAISPSAISVVPVQPSGTYTPPSIFKGLVITTSTPRKSSPLGPCPYFLPGRPVFPPSVRKQDLYRQALRKSVHRSKIHRTGKKSF